MHEYGMMEAILHDARAEADRRGGAILRIRVELGELSDVSAESLETAFMALTQGTPLEGVELQIFEIPGVVRCDACGLGGSARELGLDVSHEDPLLLCPQCGFFLTAIQGRGVALTELALRIGESTNPIEGPIPTRS